MRLSDAGLHQRPTKLIYPNHRPSPWLTGGAPRDRSNRLLDIGPPIPVWISANCKVGDTLNQNRTEFIESLGLSKFIVAIAKN